jgi:uncharacterized protein YwgA
LNRRDWLLAGIALASDRGLSPIQIQKAMFLLRMEAANEVGRQFYRFEPYNYGPFSSAIYTDVDALVMAGLVREDTSRSSTYSRYFVTQAGKDRVESLRPEMPNEAEEYLSDAVSWILRVNFTQLLKSIYAKYPRYAVNSVFRH